MRSQQMPFQSLISEKSKLAFLAIQRRPVVNHFRVDLNFVNPLHVVSQLFQVLKHLKQTR